ncbi:unnamed protein product [Hymenolepis diminuta]|uniref:Uncharacterized protein n=1 Tax=Hymenolepis diminuta TaxID=6216 RepID=A0A0R3SDV1_HYMDI|nr:unnamed protein product [Hymenolepis diminuta]
MAWFQTSNNWDLLEEIIEEERRRSEWKIGQHPLLGLDDLMRDIFHLPIPLCEEENFAQTSDSPHKSSTSEASVKLRTDETVRSESDLGRSNVLIPTSDCSPTASIREDNAQTSNFSPWTSTTEPSTNVKTGEVDKNESHLRHSSVQTYASNCSTSEQVSAQNQHTVTNGEISRSVRNHPTGKGLWERGKLGFNRLDNSNALSSYAQEENYKSEDSLIFPHFTTAVEERGKQRSMNSLATILQKPLARQKKLCPVQGQPKIDCTPEQEAPCAIQQSNFQYTKCNERCAKLKAMGLSDGEILNCLIEVCV